MNVLVVSTNCFSDVYNNGKTLESIFSSFDKRNLAQVFFSENMNPDLNFCDNYFKISDVNVLKKLLKLDETCGEIIHSDDITQKNTYSKPSFIFRFSKFFTKYFELPRDLLWKFNSWRTENFLRWIDDFNPDVIFFVGGNQGFSHDLVLYLSKTFNIPLATYFTDDYLLFPKNNSILKMIQKFRMNIFYKKTINHSSLCFAIGDTMSKSYTEFFNKEFHSIMNSVDKQVFSNYTPNKVVVYSYFGGLHLNRWKMLIRLSNSLERGLINVYSIDLPSNKILDQFKKSNINYRGSVEGYDLKKAIKDSDVLLHVESDDNKNRQLTKLSISTKIPEYLMSGRFIVGFGPTEVASMRLLSENKIGIVIPSSITSNNLKLELNKITSNPELRIELGEAGYRYAIKHFDKKIISTNFKKIIKTIYHEK
jgi:glycosyltransferase involved in cell wall biosynthesis